MKRSVWIRLLVGAAAAKVVVAFMAYLTLEGALVPIGTGWLAEVRGALSMVAFALGGMLFLVGGRSDRRAFDLGVLYLLVASAYANAPLLVWVQSLGGPLAPQAFLPKFLEELEVDAFLPLFLWSFALRFPHGHLNGYERRLGAIAVRLTAGCGIALFVVNLGSLFWPGPGGEFRRFVALLDRDDNAVFTGLVVTALAPALGMIAWRLRAESGEDSRRVRLLLGALLLGFAPILAAIFGEFVLGALFPPVGALFASHRQQLMAICFPFFWSVPFTTAYAVLVHQVLDLRLIARGILGYALARATVVVLVVIPFAFSAWHLFVERARPIGEVFAEGALLRFGAPAVFGLAMIGLRGRILAAIDRRFFREQVDARQVLTELVQRIRTAPSSEDLANLILGGIDRALHLEHSALLLEDRRTGHLEDPRRRARRLDASSPLGLAIAETSDPLEVDLANPRSPLSHLPIADRHWLADGEFRLLVPIQAGSGSLLGVIGLGAKKSDMPFLREDRRLLADLARTAALGLELQHSREREAVRPIEESAAPNEPSPRGEIQEPGAAEAARECPRCGALFRAFLVYCGNCSHRLESAPIPYVLPGRYRFEQRLGLGGMGVVYRGTDLALGRPIAAKTLRRVSPEDAVRLRREARTAARFSHSHLAGVYGIETWLGTPIMIFEYLSGGTLADRLAVGPLGVVETLELGIAMAGALDRLHQADILHRDVKPSNIGYSDEGVPKLMDFGIARAPGSRERDGAPFLLPMDEMDSTLLPPTWIGGRPGSAGGAGDARSVSTASTVTNVLAGTLPYLAPEILNGGAPDATCDLWSLSIVLLECLLGRRAFPGGDDKQIRVRIQLVRVPDLAVERPDTPPILAEMFRGLLHRARARRPETARELARRLAEVRAQL